LPSSQRLTAGLLLALCVLLAMPALAAGKPSLLQRLRELIGYNPSQAVGGSRSGAASRVCLVTPRLVSDSAAAGTPALAVVHLPSPTLLTAQPLNEIQLERNGRQLWRQRASSGSPISGPINWPITPLAPGEELLLRLRPLGASGGDFAEIRLRAGSSQQQQQALALLANPAQRLEVIEAQARGGNAALASELVFAPLATPSRQLLALRQELQAAGCRKAG